MKHKFTIVLLIESLVAQQKRIDKHLKNYDTKKRT